MYDCTTGSVSGVGAVYNRTFLDPKQRAPIERTYTLSERFAILLDRGFGWTGYGRIKLFSYNNSMEALTEKRQERALLLDRLVAERIVILDGPMGTMVQGYGIDEAGFRGDRFADHPCDLKGNNDLLSITQPDVIRESTGLTLRPGPTSSRRTPSIPTPCRCPTTRWSTSSTS